ncbi:MAG: acyl carrier protein [Bryobacterales bacterium]|nr:acyl carrier protein [Bryobacterales bacterium]
MTTAIDRTEFFQRVEEVLSEPHALDGDTQLSTVEGWDSLAFVTFIAMVDDSYGAAVSVQELLACKTAEDLAALVERGRQ